MKFILTRPTQTSFLAPPVRWRPLKQSPTIPQTLLSNFSYWKDAQIKNNKKTVFQQLFWALRKNGAGPQFNIPQTKCTKLNALNALKDTIPNSNQPRPSISIYRPIFSPFSKKYFAKFRKPNITSCRANVLVKWRSHWSQDTQENKAKIWRLKYFNVCFYRISQPSCFCLIAEFKYWSSYCEHNLRSLFTNSSYRTYQPKQNPSCFAGCNWDFPGYFFERSSIFFVLL